MICLTQRPEAYVQELDYFIRLHYTLTFPLVATGSTLACATNLQSLQGISSDPAGWASGRGGGGAQFPWESISFAIGQWLLASLHCDFILENDL